MTSPNLNLNPKRLQQCHGRNAWGKAAEVERAVYGKSAAPIQQVEIRNWNARQENSRFGEF